MNRRQLLLASGALAATFAIGPLSGTRSRLLRHSTNTSNGCANRG
jgi:hypothetical protein